MQTGKILHIDRGKKERRTERKNGKEVYCGAISFHGCAGGDDVKKTMKIGNILPEEREKNIGK